MATQNSSVEAPLTLLQLSDAAVYQAYAAYDLALEVEVLLDVVDEPNDAPKWAFPLHRMVERIRHAAEAAHDAAMQVRTGVQGVEA